MDLHIDEEPIERLDEHAGISIAFTVQRILVVSTPDAGLGGIQLNEVDVERPWLKDYDAIKGEGPTRWLKRFDTSNWGLIAAYDGGQRIAGAVVAFNTPGLHMLEGRQHVAVLWDLRVRPEARSTGVGSALFQAAEAWSKQRSCRMLMVETQNINVPACRFYVHMGCILGAINSRAYPNLPNETQLLWSKTYEDPSYRDLRPAAVRSWTPRDGAGSARTESSAGLAIGIPPEGTLNTASFGVTSVDNPLPVNADTLFQIGSITKTVTAAAVMRLVEAGVLDLDRPIQTYLPELVLSDVQAMAKVTLHHLLTRTAGWEGDDFSDTGACDDALARYVAGMVELPQLTPVGEFWSCCNSGFSLAGRVIEVATGTSYESAVPELVLGATRYAARVLLTS